MGIFGRSWWHGRGLGLAAVLIVIAVGPVTVAFWRSGSWGAEKANVAALPVAVVAVLLMVWQMRTRPKPGRVARSLAKAVAADRAAFLTQALGLRPGQFRGIRLSFADPVSGEVTASVEQMLLRWQTQGDVPLSGDQDDIADLYSDVVAASRVPGAGRLIVLGEPGSGKTVMLSFLISDLLDRLPDGELPEGVRVPVLFSLPSCDLGADALVVDSAVLADRWHRWMKARLVSDYGVSAFQAAALLWEGRVLPVLDGLDEMDPRPVHAPFDSRTVVQSSELGQVARPRAAAVLRVLNADAGEPVVVACRRMEYETITSLPTGESAPEMLSGRHVLMQPLTPGAVMNFLTHRFPMNSVGKSGRWVGVHERWRSVWEQLRLAQRLLVGGTPASGLPVVAHILQSPWLVFLAAEVFAGADTDPGVLLEMTPEQVHQFLLARLIPQVVAHDQGTARVHGWSGSDVTGWLTALAVHQRNLAQQGRSETDIHLPGLWSLGGRRWPRRITQVLVGLWPAVVGGVLVNKELHHGPASILGPGILACCAPACAWLAGLDTKDQLRRLDTAALRTSSGRRRFALGLMFGLAVGLVVGLVFGLIVTLMAEVEVNLRFGLQVDQDAGLRIGSFLALECGLVVGIVFGLAGNIHTVRRPSSLFKQSISYVLLAGSLAALVFWFEFGLVVGLGLGLTVGLAVGLTVWVRYGLGTWAARRQGLLPSRPALFLDWCVSVGLMRMSGSNPQFRHRELQDHLVDAAVDVITLSSSLESSSAWNHVPSPVEESGPLRSVITTRSNPRAPDDLAQHPPVS